LYGLIVSRADPEIEAHSRIVELEGGGPYRGHQGVRNWWKDVSTLPPTSGTKSRRSATLAM
jgi:hypothetical protein